MKNDIIKLLNLEKFNLHINKLDTVKNDNILFCYITLENNKDKCPLCNSEGIVKEYVKKKLFVSRNF